MNRVHYAVYCLNVLNYQVKGGSVTSDAVKALYVMVKRFYVAAGVMVCFHDQMRTVENQHSRENFEDSLGSYPVIQGYTSANCWRTDSLCMEPGGVELH